MTTRPLLFFVFLLIVFSCGSDEANYSTFSDAINSGGDFGSVNISQTSEDLGETESVEGDEIWTCTSTKVSVEDALGGENGFSLFSPNANVVFPGNLIQGGSLYKATPDEILADRAGGEITISILDGADVSSVDVDKISLGSVTIAANQILSGKDAESVIPSNFQFSKSIIQSEKEFALRVKADYSNAWASMSGSLSFSNNSSYSRMMVTLQQTFYTLSFTAPFNVDGFFAPTANPEDLERFMGPGNPPCYISSVNYGRIFYMLVESSASETELFAAVEGSFEGLTSQGGGSVETDYFEDIEEVNIKIFALGGDAATTLGAGGLTKNNLGDLNDILVRATDIRTAVPISYKAQSVKTNEVVAVQLATDYEKKSCFAISALPPLVITEHWTGVKDLLGSPVGAITRFSATQDHVGIGGAPIPIIFFDSAGVRCVYDDGQELHGPFENISEILSSFKLPIEDVGAGYAYAVQTGSGYKNEFVFINKRGNLATTSVSNFDTPIYLENIPALAYYKNEGISAACRGLFGSVWTVNKAGQEVHIEYDSGNINPNLIYEFPVSWLTGGPNVNGTYLPGKFPDGIAGITKLRENLYATVDKAGRRYMVVDFSDPSNIEYLGPFKL